MKKKSFVFFDRTAERAAELIALEGIAHQRRRIARIELIVADKLERVAMQAVATRLRHGVDRAARVLAILGGQRARFNLEFLQRIGEGERQVQVVEGIVMSAAIEYVGGSIGQTAADRGDCLVGVILGGDQIGIGSDGRSAGEKNQIGGIAAVQGKIDHALLIHHLPDSGAARLNHRCRCFNHHLLRNITYLQPGVDGRIGIHLQDNAVLYISIEAFLTHFEPVRPDGKALEHIAAIAPGLGVAGICPGCPRLDSGANMHAP